MKSYDMLKIDIRNLKMCVLKKTRFYLIQKLPQNNQEVFQNFRNPKKQIVVLYFFGEPSF